MKSLEKGIKIEFENKIYILRAIASTKAVKGKMVLNYFKDTADYPTDQLTFFYTGGNKILSKNLFEINQMIKKKKVKLIP